MIQIVLDGPTRTHSDLKHARQAIWWMVVWSIEAYIACWPQSYTKLQILTRKPQVVHEEYICRMPYQSEAYKAYTVCVWLTKHRGFQATIEY